LSRRKPAATTRRPRPLAALAILIPPVQRPSGTLRRQAALAPSESTDANRSFEAPHAVHPARRPEETFRKRGYARWRSTTRTGRRGASRRIEEAERPSARIASCANGRPAQQRAPAPGGDPRGKHSTSDLDSQRAAQLLIKEAEIHADRIVSQAMQRAQQVEGKIQSCARGGIQTKPRGSLERSPRSGPSEDEKAMANVHTRCCKQGVPPLRGRPANATANDGNDDLPARAGRAPLPDGIGREPPGRPRSAGCPRTATALTAWLAGQPRRDRRSLRTPRGVASRRSRALAAGSSAKAPAPISAQALWPQAWPPPCLLASSAGA
jgi:hypothetical protein